MCIFCVINSRNITLRYHLAKKTLNKFPIFFFRGNTTLPFYFSFFRENTLNAPELSLICTWSSELWKYTDNPLIFKIGGKVSKIRGVKCQKIRGTEDYLYNSKVWRVKCPQVKI